MIRDYLHTLRNLPGILTRINNELEGKASKASVDTLRHTVGKKADQDHVTKLAEIAVERFRDRPTLADLSQAKIDLGVRLDALELVIEKTGLNDLATTLAEIETPEPGLRESIRDTIAKTTSNLEAVKTGEPNLSERLSTMNQTVVAGLDAWCASGLHPVTGGWVAVDRQGNPITPVEAKAPVTKARKPRAPKGGAK